MICDNCNSMMRLKNTGRKWKEFICLKCKTLRTIMKENDYDKYASGFFTEKVS